jgi:hypothetical protein
MSSRQLSNETNSVCESIEDYVRNKELQTNIHHKFSSIGLFTFLRTYSRKQNDSDPNSLIESWNDTLLRIINGCNDQLKCGFTLDEQKELYEYLFSLKLSVAGRFLWQLGTKTVEKCGLTSLQNCAFTKIDHPIKPFSWTMNMLMLGTGVGFSIFKEDMVNIPSVKHVTIEREDTKDADFIVPDSRYGWIKLLEEVLNAHFYTGKSFKYSCILLRSKGEPIKGFGGTASGPTALCEGIHRISNILNRRAQDDAVLHPIDGLDIMCNIAQIVISGNTRRSALLSLGSHLDTEYLNAKNWGSGNVPNERCNVNCSVAVDDINDIIDDENFWKLYDGTSEPYGFINLKLHRTVGRIGETQYPDPDVAGVNPCSEQSLANHETCCLGELFLPNMESKEEFLKCATYSYRICKHSLTLPCSDSKETEEIVHKNMRMGLGITGYTQATEEQKSWLSDCYVHLRKFDDEYSAQHGFPRSIKITTVKPSGCSRGDSLIQTSQGLLRLDELKEIAGQKDEHDFSPIYNVSVSTDGWKCEMSANVSKFYDNGYGETKKIRLSSGVEIESSLSHQYRVVDNNSYEWKRVNDIKVGDKFVVALGGHHETVDKDVETAVLNDRYATFAGWYLRVKDLYTDADCLYGSTFDFFGEKFSNVFESEKVKEWIEKFVVNGKFLSKYLRSSVRKSCVAFITAYSKCSQYDDTIVVDSDCPFLSSYIPLCRSVGFNAYVQGCTFPPTYWNGFVMDEVREVVDSDCHTYDIEVDTVHHYKLNGFVSHNTLSLLGGVSSGIHGCFAEHYIRRVRISSEHPLLKLAKSYGYHTEPVYSFDGTVDHTTSIVSFPIKIKSDAIFCDNHGAIDQLELIKHVQTVWSDNAISNTTTYKMEELPAIKEWLRKNYNDNIKSVSFLLYFNSGFKQMPLEKITEDEYNKMVEKCRPITDTAGITYQEESEEMLMQGESCAGGACPMR